MNEAIKTSASLRSCIRLRYSLGIALAFVVIAPLTGVANEAATREYRCGRPPAPSLISVVTPRFVEGTPDWKPGQPLPVAEEIIVEAARTELSRHVARSAEWICDGMDLIRYRNVNGSAYYCLVYFSSPERHGFSDIFVPVNLNGKVSPLIHPPEANKK